MLRIGLIGYGQRGSVLHRLLRDVADAEVAAIGEIDPAAQVRARHETGRPVFHPWCQSWPTGTPDVIVLATPPRARAALLEHVALPGVRTVLVEKPAAVTLAELLQMQRVCARVGATLSVAHHWRFCPALRALRALVAEGRLGTIESAQASGYGNLLDQGCHLLDAIRWVLGGPAVLWAAAHGTNDREVLSRLSGDAAAVTADPHHPAPLWTTAELTLAGDVRVRMESGPLIQQTQAPLGVWHERRFRLVGTRGSAECRPGHYLRLQVPGSDVADIILHPGSLETASKLLLEAVLESARSGAPLPVPADDARQTLEGLLLCGVSLRDGNVAVAPVRAAENPFADVTRDRRYSSRRRVPRSVDAAAPRFSVLVPLLDARGFGERCLQGWLAQEGFAGSDYELLLLDNGTESALAERLRPYLRSQDRIVLEPDSRRTALYRRGALNAAGEYLLLTESHCVPEPDLLAELDRYLQQHDVDGACCRSIPVCYNDLARADAALFESGFREFRRDSDWRKVNVHGFALRRDVYQLVGGLRPRYDLYAEMVLAADLRDAGVRLGYAAGAAVNHHYRVTLHELAEHLDGFVRGELQYRGDYGHTDRIGFSLLELCRELPVSRAARRECVEAEWRRLLRDARRGDFSAAGALLGHVHRELSEGFPGEIRSRWQVLAARLACWWSRHDDARLLLAYRRFFAAATELTQRQLRRCASLPVPERADLELAPQDLPSDWLYGFYPVETCESRPFRWTGPAAGIDLPLTAGEYVVEIETGRIRPWPASLRWTLCGRAIAADRIEYGETGCRLRLTVPESPVGVRRTLGLSCRPWDVVSARPLGVPIFGLRCRRMSGSEWDREGLRPLRAHTPEQLPIARAA